MTAINDFDQEVSKAVDQTGHVLSIPFQAMGWVIDKLKNPIPLEERQPPKKSQILVTAQKALNEVRKYHLNIFHSTSEWSDTIKSGTVATVQTVLWPLKFSKIGESIRCTLSEKVMGNIAKALSFCVLQLFHVSAYLLPLALTSGALFLYHKATVGTITVLAGTILMVQILLIWQLVSAVHEGNRILQKQGTLLYQNTEVFHIVKTFGASTLKTISWISTCWIPQRAIDRLKKFELMKYLYSDSAEE